LERKEVQAAQHYGRLQQGTALCPGRHFPAIGKSGLGIGMDCRRSGPPKAIRVDNEPEFISNKLGQWCTKSKVKLLFIQPQKPTQNAFIKRLNSNLRKEALNTYVFLDLKQARKTINEWMIDYNQKKATSSIRIQNAN
tara:strand:- start:3786 stop:4199 length:414 start_codon:yes stop_codon:yes gene_type:complete